MKLFLIGFRIQPEEVEGMVPNGITVSIQEEKNIVHIFFSKEQARAIHAAHRLVGKIITQFEQMILNSILPEVSSRDMIVLHGVAASELAEVFFDKQSAPDDFQKTLGIFDIHGPDLISDEDPYVELAVNEVDGTTSIHIIASLDQFNEVVASCESSMQQEFIMSLLTVFHSIGMPQSSSKRAMLIDGFAAQVFGSGFNMRCYRAYLEQKKEQEKLAEEQSQVDDGRMSRILFCNIVSAEIAKKSHTCVCGILILQNKMGYRCTIFYSKHQGIVYTLEANDVRREKEVLEAMQVSDLPFSSLRAAVVLDGVIASTFIDAYRAHVAAEVTQEEKILYANFKPEICNLYFSRSQDDQAFALIYVARSRDEQFLYICNSKKQVLLLYKEYEKLLNKKSLAQVKKELNKSVLPTDSDKPTVLLDGVYARVAIRGMRIMNALQSAN